MRNFLLAVTLCCFCFFACDNTSDRVSVNNPVPWFKMTESEIISAKGGELERTFSNDKEGTLLASLTYNEPWFDLPTVASYLVEDQGKKVVQINLNFKGGQKKREGVIEGVSNYLGLPKAQGVAGSGAPSNYFAYWDRVGFTGVYQEFDDHIDVYFIPVNDELDKAIIPAAPIKTDTLDDPSDSLSSK